MMDQQHGAERATVTCLVDCLESRAVYRDVKSELLLSVLFAPQHSYVVVVVVIVVVLVVVILLQRD